MHRQIRTGLGMSTALLLALASCDGCGPTTAGTGDSGGSTTGTDSGGVTLDASGGEGGLLDAVAPLDGGGEDVDPLVQNLPDFCAGSGAVVSFGDEGICAGDLASQTFRFALCACEGISTTAQLTVDSFDSADGPYNASSPGDDGQLGLNEGPLTLDRKLTVQGSAFVGGGGLGLGPDSLISQNLYADGDVSMTGGGSQGTIGRNAYINGDLGDRITVEGDLTLPATATVNGTVNGTTTQADIPAILPCPCATEQILDIAALTGWAATNNDNEVWAVDEDAGMVIEDGGALGLDPTLYEDGGPQTLVLPCGRFYLTEVIQPSSLDIVVRDRAVLFIDGNLSANRFTITVEDGGELDLFVAGDVAIGAAADFGSPDRPAAVRTYIGGNMTLQANAEFAGNVYAPNAEIIFGAQASLYGSLMVRSVSFTAAGFVHFDSAIRRAGEACASPVDPDGGVVLLPDGGVAEAGQVDAAGEDAGPDGCTGICSFECAEYACLIDPGQSTGVCGACRTDLDCCAPLLCDEIGGTCYYPGG